MRDQNLRPDDAAKSPDAAAKRLVRRDVALFWSGADLKSRIEALAVPTNPRREPRDHADAQRGVVQRRNAVENACARIRAVAAYRGCRNVAQRRSGCAGSER